MLFVLITVCMVLLALCISLTVALVLSVIARKQEVGWLSVELHSLRENFAKDAMEYEHKVDLLSAEIKSLQIQLQELRKTRDSRNMILGHG
jgi:hypothetical protein